MNRQQDSTQIDILRHGHCEGGEIFRGHTDVSLSSTGREQMRRACALADARWQVLVTSPLKRCLAFAEHLQAEHNLPLEIADDLREMSFGIWDGREIASVRAEHSEAVAAWSADPSAFIPPEGEGLMDLSVRVAACFTDIVERHRGKKVLIVTHGGVIRALLTHALGMPLRQANAFEVPYACMSRLQAFHGQRQTQLKLAAHNFAAHNLGPLDPALNRVAADETAVHIATQPQL